MEKKKIISDGVIAKGEATGHAHQMHRASVFEEDGVICFTAEAGATITHEEHKPIQFAADDYKTGIKKEYDHFAEKARNVRD